MYQLGDKALKVSMKLFALNRKNLLDRLRAHPNLPKSSVILLQGGEAKFRHCTDHEELFRQVRFSFIRLVIVNYKVINLRNLIFIGVSESQNLIFTVLLMSIAVNQYCLHLCYQLNTQYGWESN